MVISMPRLEEKIRQIWIIEILLDCEEKKQKEIVNELTNRVNEKDADIDLPEKKISDKIYKSLGIIESEGIIKRKIKSRELSAWLIKDINTDPNPLHNILMKYYDPLLMEIDFKNEYEFQDYYNFIRSLQNHLVSSKYYTILVNDFLLRKFEREFKVSLNYDESKKVLEFLKISPLAVLNSFKKIESLKLANERFLKLKNEIKSLWLNDIQKDAYTESSSFNYIPPYPIKLKQKIKTTIRKIDEDKEFTLINESSITCKPSKYISRLPTYQIKSIQSPLGKFREPKKKS